MQDVDGATESNIEGTAPYQLPDMSLTLSGSDHSATLQALSAASSHSNNLDILGSSRQGSMQPADADGITSSQELQQSGELARDGAAALRPGLAGPAPGETLRHDQVLHHAPHAACTCLTCTAAPVALLFT